MKDKEQDKAVKNLAEKDKLLENDVAIIETAKMKRELSLANVKSALVQSENAELSYNNILLQLALKYRLNEGDVIEEDGTIKRNKKG